MTGLYETDFHAWTQQQARALRALQRDGGIRRNDLDLQHLAEEMESMGASERRELINRLRVLLTHLLKWHYQPERRERSWELTIIEQREQIAIHLRQNPSLKAFLSEALSDGYRLAVLRAEREAGITGLPAQCPYTPDAVLAQDWLPDDSDSIHSAAGDPIT